MIDVAAPRVCVRELYSESRPLALHAGGTLEPVHVAYETYGELDATRSNTVFVCHALTGDSHAARHDGDDDPGWWDVMVGPGCPIDTGRYHVVCANVLGGCAGTTGPSSLTSGGLPYGPDFPEVHVRDIVRVHRRLVAELGIGRLHAVIGGSLGGMQVLDWFLQAPHEAERFFVIAASAQLSADDLAWNAVSRAAIRSDPRFEAGRYRAGAGPVHGLGLARMIAHLTYLCEDSLQAKFGRDARSTNGVSGHPVLDGSFAVEEYLEHQARMLVQRFDANSYLYLTRAMDVFEPFATASAIERGEEEPRVELFSFVNDRLFGCGHSELIHRKLLQLGATNVHHHREAARTVGHDAFLVDTPAFLEAVRLRMASPRP